MAHVHRPGRVGRDIFDVHPPPRADPRAAVGGAVGQDGAKLVVPDVGREPDVDEAGPGDLGAHHLVQRLQPRRDQLGESARVGAGALGEHHRRVGGEIAVRGIARRLDRHRLALEPGRQRALAFESVEDGVEMRGEAGVEGHDGSGFRGARGLDDVRGDLKAGGLAPSSRRRASPASRRICERFVDAGRVPGSVSAGRRSRRSPDRDATIGVDRREAVETPAQDQVHHRARAIAIRSPGRRSPPRGPRSRPG